ncbi:MAG: TonB-dependent receptor, partial [Pacificimonas sp.]|nr:TonB-dependent receptor [Pacificimonas sp.]
GFANLDRAPNTLPEVRANAYVNVNTGGLNARYTLNYTSGVEEDAAVRLTNPFADDSGSYVRQDFVVTYDLPLNMDLGIQLRGGVLNIFDEDPPLAEIPLSYNPFLGDALGRHFQLGAKVTF